MYTRINTGFVGFFDLDFWAVYTLFSLDLGLYFLSEIPLDAVFTRFLRVFYKFFRCIHSILTVFLEESPFYAVSDGFGVDFGCIHPFCFWRLLGGVSCGSDAGQQTPAPGLPVASDIRPGRAAAVYNCVFCIKNETKKPVFTVYQTDRRPRPRCFADQ